MNIVMIYAAEQLGYPYGKVVRDGKKLADSMLLCYERYGIDCLDVISDSVREIEDLGAEVVIPEKGVPHLKQPFITDEDDFEKLIRVEPRLGRAMSDRIESVRLMKEAAKGEVAVVGWVEGAFAAACNMMTVQEFMYFMMEEPDSARELLDYCYTLERDFALAQVEAGADIIGIGDAATSMIGPKLYEEFAFDYEKRMIEEIHAAGALVKLHICGNINPFLKRASETGTDILDADHMVDFKATADYMQDIGAACGNFDPLSVMLRGTPADVRTAVNRCIDLAPRNSIIAAGCEIPPGTPEANMFAVRDALIERGNA